MPKPVLPNPLPESLDDKLKRLVRASGKAQRPLARDAHITYYTFYRWYTGRSAKSLNCSAVERLWLVLTGESLMK